MTYPFFSLLYITLAVHAYNRACNYRNSKCKDKVHTCQYILSIDVAYMYIVSCKTKIQLNVCEYCELLFAQRLRIERVRDETYSENHYLL